MNRRRFLALSGLALGLAGCSQQSGTPIDANTSTPADSPTPTGTPTETATPTDEPTATATPAFEPQFFWDSCTRATVQAARYDSVTLFFSDSFQQFTGPFSGANTFAGTGEHAGSVVQSVSASLGDRTRSRDNPEPWKCRNTATPEETETPAETDTPPETETPTETPEQTQTATVRPGSRVSIESEHRLVDEGSDNERVIVDATITNDHDYDVRIDLEVYVETSTHGYRIGDETITVPAGDSVEKQWEYRGEDADRVENHRIKRNVEKA